MGNFLAFVNIRTLKQVWFFSKLNLWTVKKLFQSIQILRINTVLSILDNKFGMNFKMANFEDAVYCNNNFDQMQWVITFLTSDIHPKGVWQIPSLCNFTMTMTMHSGMVRNPDPLGSRNHNLWLNLKVPSPKYFWKSSKVA